MTKKSLPYSFLILLLLFLAACAGGGSSTTQSSNGKKGTNLDKTNTSLIAWPAFDGGGPRSGINSAEKTITPDNVKNLTQLWQVSLPDTADSSPIELPNVHTASGVKDLLFVTTMPGSLLAIDANNGTIVWRQDTHGPKFTTSSPALDPSGKYVYGYGVDGKIHKYDVGTGNEITGDGWPKTITLMPDVEKGSSPLNIANGYLYMTTSGYPGDAGHYEGHAIAIKLSTGQMTVFNSLCSNIRQLLDDVPTDPNYCSQVQSGIWARGGAVVDPLTGNVYVSTGNGDYNANQGGHDYGDSVIELNANLTKVIDTYTPTNYASLDASDSDLGSAVLTFLPKQASSSTSYLGVQASKDEYLRLINRQNMSGQGGPGHVSGEVQKLRLSQGCTVPTRPVAWNDTHNVTWVFVANSCGLSAYKIVTDASGHTTMQPAYQNANGGSSPFIANGILFVQDNNIIRAMNPTNGNVLWSAPIGSLHWQSPIVVNAHLYVPDDSGNLTAFGFAQP